MEQAFEYHLLGHQDSLFVGIRCRKGILLDPEEPPWLLDGV